MSKKFDTGGLVAAAARALSGDEKILDEVPLVRRGDRWAMKYDAIMIRMGSGGGMEIGFSWKGIELPAKETVSVQPVDFQRGDTLNITGVEGLTKVSFGG